MVGISTPRRLKHTQHPILALMPPTVNFINNLRRNFLYETSFWQLFSRYMYVKKRRLYEKFVRLC